jgi:hypothetical protein
MAGWPGIGQLCRSSTDPELGHTYQPQYEYYGMANGTHDRSYRIDRGGIQYYPHQQTSYVRVHSPGRT